MFAATRSASHRGFFIDVEVLNRHYSGLWLSILPASLSKTEYKTRSKLGLVFVRTLRFN